MVESWCHTWKLAASIDALVNPFQYTARESDTETGLYYYRARYYDPQISRFISEDPLRFFGGEVDFYSYVEQNPVNLTDPLGLLCRCSYSQSTGNLVCFDVFTGARYVDVFRYSGYGHGKNDPDMQGIEWVGPLPRGEYSIGQTLDRKKTGPMTIILMFERETTDPFPSNRSKGQMRIHGDKKGKPPGNASEGCIVVNRDVRKTITDDCGSGSTLTVGP
jgi:RHS repeat-associated protein